MMGLRVVAGPFKVHGNGELDHKGAATSRFVQMLQHVAHLGVFGPWQTGYRLVKVSIRSFSAQPPPPIGPAAASYGILCVSNADGAQSRLTSVSGLLESA